MKRVLILLILCMTTPLFAQLPEMMGNLSIQGQLTAQGARSAHQGMQSLSHTQLLHAIQQVALEIKMNNLSGYQQVNKNRLTTSLPQNVQWDVLGNEREFYIFLKNINASACQYLSSMRADARAIEINGGENACISNNNLKLIYE